jgi:hypothetical protein
MQTQTLISELPANTQVLKGLRAIIGDPATFSDSDRVWKSPALDAIDQALRWRDLLKNDQSTRREIKAPIEGQGHVGGPEGEP